METDRLSRRRAGDGVEHRALHRELAVVAEAPRPGGAGRFGEPAGVTGLVGPLRSRCSSSKICVSARSPSLRAPPRCDLEPTVTTLEQAGLFEQTLDLLQTPQILCRLVAEGASHRVLVDVVQRGARVVAPHRSVEFFVVVQAFDRVYRRRHAHAVGPVAVGAGPRPTPCLGRQPAGSRSAGRPRTRGPCPASPARPASRAPRAVPAKATPSARSSPPCDGPCFRAARRGSSDRRGTGRRVVP